jgi:hypothetical protein
MVEFRNRRVTKFQTIYDEKFVIEDDGDAIVKLSIVRGEGRFEEAKEILQSTGDEAVELASLLIDAALAVGIGPTAVPK